MAEDDLDLDGAVERQRGDPHGRARVAAGVAEDLAEHLARTVDDAGLAREVGNGCHEADDLDDAGEPVDTADGGRRRREGVQSALTGVRLGVLRGYQPGPSPTLPVAGSAPETIGS